MTKSRNLRMRASARCVAVAVGVSPDGGPSCVGAGGGRWRNPTARLMVATVRHIQRDAPPTLVFDVVEKSTTPAPKTAAAAQKYSEGRNWEGSSTSLIYGPPKRKDESGNRTFAQIQGGWWRRGRYWEQWVGVLWIAPGGGAQLDGGPAALGAVRHPLCNPRCNV